MDIKKLLENTEVANEIIMATSILSNNSNKAWVEDSTKLIEFICNSYNMGDLAKDYVHVITKEINNLSLIDEYRGLKGLHEFNDEYSPIDSFYDLKGKTLLRLKTFDEILAQCQCPLIEEFTYTYANNYMPKDRFATILKASSYGMVQFTCQIGLMYATAIGTEQDIPFAIIRLKQAAYWGYIPAVKYLAYIYKLQNDEKNYQFYTDLYEVCTGLFFDGINVVPEDKKDRYSKEVCETFSLMTNLYQDIVIPFSPRIDYSFLDLMFTEKLLYGKKMQCINDYRGRSWKEMLIPTQSNSIFNFS